MGSICWDSISLLFSIGIGALFFIPAISVVLILVAIVVQEVRGKKTDSPMKILLGGICFIGLSILAVVAILASGFVLRENYQHKAFYSVPATQLKNIRQLMSGLMNAKR